MRTAGKCCYSPAHLEGAGRGAAAAGLGARSCPVRRLQRRPPPQGARRHVAPRHLRATQHLTWNFLMQESAFEH